MKKNRMTRNFTTQIRKAVLLLLAIVFATGLSAQEKASTEPKEFQIVIEKTDKGIKMTSKNGCAWKELGFELKKNKKMGINEFGMIEEKENHTDSDPKLADFLFTIAKTTKGVELIGKKGTAWKRLSFSLPKGKTQAIDQLGMRKKKK